MTSPAQAVVAPQTDVRTIVGGGIKLGIATAIGVVVFALLSRALAGRTEVIVQSLLILAGGTVFAYAPSYWVRPRGVDTSAWAALLGLLGSVAFTIVDTAILRPVDLYHWTWDAIGGGSGFWYVPVWWMGSCVLAWLGAWVHSIVAARGGDVVNAALRTAGLSVLLFLGLTVSGLAPFHAAVAALAYTLALIVHVPLAAASRAR
ncbi:MAG: hypothetical protein HYW06_13195 [Gemmatimonadetes bacterium]|nr:hypothetical protein [Gemmatimonadota bacterium]